MQGVWLEDQKISLKKDLPVPVPKEGEVLVKVLRAGVCNTDLELIQGYYPYKGILGHEFVGRVVEGRLKEERVVGGINVACNVCTLCKSGLKLHCSNRNVLGIKNKHGTFAEYLTLPEANIHLIPPAVSVKDACFTEPLAAALAVQEQIEIGPQHNVLVVGDGKLGLLIAQTLTLTGCRLLVVGHHLENLEILTRKGISTEIVPDKVSKADYDISVECTGSPDGFKLALSALKPRGTMVLKSTYTAPLTVETSAIVVNEIRIMGSRCGPMDKAVGLLESGQIDVSSLLTRTYPLSEAVEAIEHAKKKGVLKIQININD